MRASVGSVLLAAVLLGGAGCGREEVRSKPKPASPAAPDTQVPDAPTDADAVLPLGSLQPLTVDITIDATDPASGWLRVSQVWRGIDGPFSVRKHGDSSYSFRNVDYLANGESLGARPKSNRYEVRRKPVPAELTVTYEVKPGGDGRHGKQGFFDDRFAVFDGRALLLPIAPQPLERARFRFDLPDGWTPATALTAADDGWWVADRPSGSVLRERLMKECHGLGPWERQDFVRGNTEVRSFVHAELEPELRKRVMEDTDAVWGWFHDAVGFDPGFPMAFVRTPADNGGRIFGGASMVGACYEAEWDKSPHRNRYLLGHRFGHPFNKYPPAGLTSHGPEEHWFTEAWASYAEVLAVEETGRIPSPDYFARLWEVHRRRTAGHDGWFGYPMADEASSSGDAREYLHYFRGPLLVRTLAHLVEERSDTDLEAFMKDLGQRHRGHRTPYHLQAELEAFTGADFSDFWSAYVHGHVWVVPSFPSIVDADVRDRAKAPMIASSAGVGFDANYLAALGSSGRFHDVGALLDFVGREGPTRRALADADVRLVPPVVHDHVAGLPPLARESLARAEAAWPVHALGRLRTEVEPELRWLEHPLADAWKRMASTAAADRELTMAGGLDRIAVRIGDKETAGDRPDVLAVPPDEQLTLYLWWREPVGAVRIEVLHEGEVAWSTEVTEQPGWVRNRLKLDVGDRPSSSGLLTVRVYGQRDELLGQRHFLQWMPEAAAE